ncbi:hypothetical protein KR222_010604, partial [Zaprionus bogoriensis]
FRSVIMLRCLVLALLLLPLAAGENVNCSEASAELGTCSSLSANGCCAKGCVRNAIGRCVQELCMSDGWDGWLKRPASVSCHFHWFLLTFACLILILMLLLLTCNVAFEVRRCLRKRRQSRYVRFTPSNSPSSSMA